MSDLNLINNRPLKLNQKLVVFFIPFLLLGDFLGAFYGEGNEVLPIVRGLISTIYMLILLLHTSFRYRINRSVWYFVVYVSCLFFFASDVMYSVNVSSKVFISLFCLIIGYSYIYSHKAMMSLCRSLLFSSTIAIISIMLAQIFNLGQRTYSLDVELGFISGLNTYTYLILLAPLYYLFESSRLRKLLYNILFVAMVIYVIVSFKRVAIAGIFVGYFVFFSVYRKQIKLVKYTLLLALALFALSPLYKSVLGKQFEARKDRFENNALENESRYLETPVIWNEVLGFSNPIKSVFGLEAFNTIGMYGGGSFKERMAHVDFNGIVISNGLFGLFLYFNIYYSIFKRKSKQKYSPKSNNYRTANAVFWALYVTSLFTSLSGGIMELAFRSIIFVYMGALIRYMELLSNEMHLDSDGKLNMYSSNTNKHIV